MGTKTITAGHTVGQASLIVMKYDLNANTVAMYVNPTLGTEPAVANASGVLPTDYGFRNAYAYLGNDPNQGSMDELRFGTDYASVTPASAVVPEPATFGLVAAAGLLGLRRRRA